MVVWKKDRTRCSRKQTRNPISLPISLSFFSFCCGKMPDCERDTVCSEVLSFEVPGLSWDLCLQRTSACRDDRGQKNRNRAKPHKIGRERKLQLDHQHFWTLYLSAQIKIIGQIRRDVQGMPRNKTSWTESRIAAGRSSSPAICSWEYRHPCPFSPSVASIQHSYLFPMSAEVTFLEVKSLTCSTQQINKM